MQDIQFQTGYQQWAADPRRARSGEHDFGAWWTIGGNPRSYPRYRLSWIEDTGELYAVCHDGGKPDRFILIARFPDAESVERALEGWTDITPNLPAIMAQARGHSPAPKQVRALAVTELGKESFPLDGVDLDELDNADGGAGKTYRGFRPADNEIGDCRVVVIENGKARPLRHVVLHSPSGLEFGYGGSGPADLALSILADYFGERPTSKQLSSGACQCWRHHQDFKWAFIAVAPRESFTITSDQIKDWLAENADPLAPAGETPDEEE